MDGEIPCCVGCPTNNRVKKEYGIYSVLPADSRQCGQFSDQLSTHSIVTLTAALFTFACQVICLTLHQPVIHLFINCLFNYTPSTAVSQLKVLLSR